MRSLSSSHRGRRRFLPLAVERLEVRLNPGFLDPLAFGTGDGPNSTAMGDFNGDGLQDLAVANVRGNSVSVLLGNGDGSFGAVQTLSAGGSPWSVAVDDLDGDGALDLAVANYGGNSVSVRLGNGDGSFRDAQNFAAGNGPSSLAVADLNGDGLSDLAVANVFDHTVSVLLGNGDSTFQAAQDFPAGAKPVSVTVGEFNGDGAPDLALTGYSVECDPCSREDETVRVLLGNADGSFQAIQRFDAGLGPQSVTVGDVNGDALSDLVVTGHEFICLDPPACFDVQPVDESVRVLLGNGDGTFQAAGGGEAGRQPVFVAVADINGDGLLDAVVANKLNTSGTVSVLLGHGDGTFQTVQSFPVGNRPTSVAVGDVNGDGWLDVVVPNLDSNNGSVLLNDGAWTGPGPAPGSGRAPDRFACDDLGGRHAPAVLARPETTPVAERPPVLATPPDLLPKPAAASPPHRSALAPPRLQDGVFAALRAWEPA